MPDDAPLSARGFLARSNERSNERLSESVDAKPLRVRAVLVDMLGLKNPCLSAGFVVSLDEL